MENTTIFETGTINVNGNGKDAVELGWNPHPSFKGVFMKNLVMGSDTEGRLSCHIVRIDPGCEIGEHVHAGKMELHEIVSGSGKCDIGEETLDYRPGTLAYIPDDTRHRVTAGNDGLTILAKFSPALV